MACVLISYVWPHPIGWRVKGNETWMHRAQFWLQQFKMAHKINFWAILHLNYLLQIPLGLKIQSSSQSPIIKVLNPLFWFHIINRNFKLTVYLLQLTAVAVLLLNMQRIYQRLRAGSLASHILWHANEDIPWAMWIKRSFAVIPHGLIHQHVKVRQCFHRKTLFPKKLGYRSRDTIYIVPCQFPWVCEKTHLVKVSLTSIKIQNLRQL